MSIQDWNSSRGTKHLQPSRQARYTSTTLARSCGLSQHFEDGTCHQSRQRQRLYYDFADRALIPVPSDWRPDLLTWAAGHIDPMCLMNWTRIKTGWHSSNFLARFHSVRTSSSKCGHHRAITRGHLRFFETPEYRQVFCVQPAPVECCKPLSDIFATDQSTGLIVPKAAGLLLIAGISSGGAGVLNSRCL
jgi:hypothetical protein